MLLINNETVKMYFISSLYQINKAFFKGEPVDNLSFCQDFGSILSEEERQECYAQVITLLKKDGIVFNKAMKAGIK